VNSEAEKDYQGLRRRVCVQVDRSVGNGWWRWLPNIVNVPNATGCTLKNGYNSKIYVICILL
jgi:hypothetical protein